MPKERELKAYIVYANNLVVLRFGADATRTGRARTLLAELNDAPSSMHYLGIAKASDALARGNAAEALRLSRNDPAGRDVATLASAELNDNAQTGAPLRLVQHCIVTIESSAQIDSPALKRMPLVL